MRKLMISLLFLIPLFTHADNEAAWEYIESDKIKYDMNTAIPLTKREFVKNKIAVKKGLSKPYKYIKKGNKDEYKRTAE